MAKTQAVDGEVTLRERPSSGTGKVAALAADAPGAGAPDYLVPRMREYEVGETTQYQSAHIVGLHSDAETSEITAALDPFAPDTGFTGGRPVEGVLLTHRQGWQQVGLTLGELLHSICLAPGEATRIAVVDWRRQARSAGTEDIDESDRLAREDEQNRAVSEVQRAVARETQTGSSLTRVDSRSRQRGSSGSFFGLAGGSSGRSSLTSTTSSVSFSAGRRDLSSEANQNIHQRTRELAEAARSRRAAAVREVDERESETVSTRVVANYNHMHALTVMYFEVLQVFALTTRVTRAERLIFLPMKVITFTPAEIRKHRETLIDIAGDFGLEDLRTTLLCSPRGADIRPEDAVPGGAEFDEGEIQKEITSLQEEIVGQHAELAKINEDIKLLESEIETLDKFIKEAPVRFSILLDQSKRAQETNNFPEIMKLDTQRRNLTDNLSNKEKEQKNKVVNKRKKQSRLLLINDDIENKKGRIGDLSSAIQIIKQNRLPVGLNSKKLFFNQQLWLRLEAHQIYGLVAGHSYGGRPLAGWMNPEPITVFGNYVGFRLPFADDEVEADGKTNAKDAFDARHVGAKDAVETTRIALPSGGVFAEAVLGEANSAEEIDLGRFWNWSDSPIPIQPPEIAPVETGSRATIGEAAPGQLGDAAVQLQGRGAMPDPAGGLIQMLAASQVFRDMGGLAGGQRAASEAGAETGRGASDAAGQATAANAAVLDFLKTAAETGGKLLTAKSATVLGGLLKLSDRAASGDSAPKKDDGGS